VANNYAVFANAGGVLAMTDCDVSSTTGCGIACEGSDLIVTKCLVHDCKSHGVAVFGDLLGTSAVEKSKSVSSQKTAATAWSCGKARSVPSTECEIVENRGYAVSLTAVSLAFFALSGVTFVLPFYLQILRGFDTLSAGLAFVPFAVGQIIAAPRSAAMVEKFGYKVVMSVGLGAVAVALGALSVIQIDTPILAGARDFLYLRVRYGQRNCSSFNRYAKRIAAGSRRRWIRCPKYGPSSRWGTRCCSNWNDPCDSLRE